MHRLEPHVKARRFSGLRFSGTYDEPIQANISALHVTPSGANVANISALPLTPTAANVGFDPSSDSCIDVDVTTEFGIDAQLGKHFRKLTRHIDSWMEHQEILIKTMRAGGDIATPLRVPPPSTPVQPNPPNRLSSSMHSGSSGPSMASEVKSKQSSSSPFRKVGSQDTTTTYGDLRALSMDSSAPAIQQATAQIAVHSRASIRTDQEFRKSINFLAKEYSGSHGGSDLGSTLSSQPERKDLDKIQSIHLKKRKKRQHSALKRQFSAQPLAAHPKASEEFQWPNDILAGTPTRGRLASIVSFEDDTRKSQAVAEGIRKSQSVPSHMPSDATTVKSRHSSISVHAEACSSAAARVVHGSRFPALIAGLILTNAMFVGVDIEWSATHPDQDPDDTPAFLLIIGYFYSAAFLCELILRLVADRLKFFYGEGVAWNYLDFVLVLISLVEIILDVVNAGKRSDKSSSNARLMRLIRITRLLRVIRVIRVIRFVHALRTLVHSILSTLRSLLWAMILLTLIIYVFGIIFTQAATTYFEDNIDADASLYWSSLGRSLLTLFKSVSGGLSWHEAVIPLGHMHPVYVVLFLIFVTFTYFAVLNVVTGVFCQSAVESATHDYDLVIQSQLRNRRMYEQKIENLFKEIDQLGTGEITIDEFETFLESPQTQAYFASLELDTEDAWTLFKLLDVDTSHQLDLEEFLMGCLRLRGSAKAIEMAKMQYENRIMRRKTMEFIIFVEAAFKVLLVHLGVDLNALASGLAAHPRKAQWTNTDATMAGATGDASDFDLNRS